MTYTDTDTSKQAETALEASQSLPPYDLNDLLALSSEHAAVSPAVARHMRDTMHFERQRQITSRHVDRLAQEMRRGWFLAGTPIFICVMPDGRQFIVNGNHTLEAVHASGITLPLTIIRKKVRTFEDVAACYATFDIQKTRTWGDALKAAGVATEIPNATKVVAALALIQSGFWDQGYTDFTSRRKRLDLLPEYTQAAHLLHVAAEGAPSANQKILHRAAFLGVALYTARYQPTTAEEFWGGMAKDDGLAKNDPRKSLLRFGISNPISGGGTQRLYHAKAAMLAWNAFFEGRTLEHCRPSSMIAPRILGTPLHKGRD